MEVQSIFDRVRAAEARWLVTGCAGFIGSHLVETLLRLGQYVVGLDNFSTGHRTNLEDVRDQIGAAAWRNFTLVEGDIRDFALCERASTGVDIVLHQAALGSVPRSFADPIATDQTNVGGFLNICLASSRAGARRIVYASSSSVYGDLELSPKREDTLGTPLSPYAVSKRADELYAHTLNNTLNAIGLRYFNVFGPRQDPKGQYAAVIPRWTASCLRGEECTIFGDGLTSRDFCFIDNVVQANLCAALAPAEVGQRIFNIALEDSTTLNQLLAYIQASIAKMRPEVQFRAAKYAPFRPGDVRHSKADISRARQILGYQPTVPVDDGIDRTVRWFAERFA